MALSDRNIVITPNKSKSDDPKIVFSGANAAVSAQNITLRVYPDNTGTLSFEGSAGQLFSITNSLTGTIFSVNDVSGMPSISVDSSGIVLLAPFGGKVGVGTASSFGLTSNVFSLYGTAMVYGNLDLANPAGGTSGIYFNDGTYLSSATAFSGALTLTSAAPQITLNNGTSNWIQWASAGVAAPAFTTRSLGTKLVLYPNIGGSTVDFALGIDNDTLWNSVPATSGLFKWYGGTTLAATLTGAGALTTTSSTTSTAFIPSGNTVPTNGMFLPATNSVGFSTNSGEKMRIEANGRVGIGTSAPNSVFNVNATTVPLFQTSNAQIGGNNFEILVGNSVVHGVTLGYVNNTAVPYGYISAGTSTRNIIVAANGRVGIGGAAVPQTLLDVGGGAVFGATWAGNTNFINPPTNGLSIQGSVGVGTYTPLSTLDVNGVASFRSAISTASTATVASLVSNGAISTGSVSDAAYTRIVNPGGGVWSHTTGTVTGALAITLPVAATNTMIAITIKVYEYVTNESFELHVGGYPYSGNTWANNPFAYIVGNPSIDRRFNVRLGYTAGAKMIIYIGELADTWSFPQVFVTEVLCGYSGQTASYLSGWSIAATTAAFENVTATISSNDIQVGYAVSTNTASSVVKRDASGNFSAGTITATLSGTATSAGSATTAGTATNQSGGTVNATTGAFSGALTLTSAAPQINLNNGTSNWIAWSSAGVAAPTFTTRSVGTKLVLYPSVAAAAADYAIGIESGTLWQSVDTTSALFKWYGGTTLAATLTGAGALTTTSTVTGTRLVSTIATGTAPLGVTSTTVVSNLNSDLLDGLHLNTSGRANLANEVVRTDASGYIQAGWINTTSGDNGTTAIDRVYASSDGYIRYYTPANFRTVLTVPTRTGGDASGTWSINVTGSAGTAGTATNQSGGTVSATTGSFSGTITLPTGGGTCLIKAGTGDGASFTVYNLKINSWWGIGFGDYQDLTTVKMYIDTRSGHLGMSGSLGVGGAAGATNGTILATNEVTAYSSDGRLKLNVEPIPDSISKVKKLRGVTFDWDVEKTRKLDFDPVKTHDVGVIAQDVQEVLPEAVRPAPFDHEMTDGVYASKSGENYLTVQYEKLTALLIEAVKDQQKMIDDLKARVSALESARN